jgi:RNAse (barnase) inhibitor barstar
VPLRWLLVDDCTADPPGDAIAVCADVEGLFTDSPNTPQHTTLLGCRPLPPLKRALDALAKGAGRPGGALHRRQISASLYSVDRAGAPTGMLGANIQASVTDVHPSVLSPGLFDITVDSAIADPLPSAARQIWDLWCEGRPTARGLWVGYDRELRHHWSGAALAHHPRDRPGKPAGTTYHLDGRAVTEIEGFYCALGEAVNGPGGYFGWNADALHDCVTGGWGAEWPFRIVWSDAVVARAHLDFAQILGWLTEDGIEIEVR